MKSFITPIIAAVGIGSIGGCAPPAKAPEPQSAAATDASTGLLCVNLAQIRETKVVDDNTIDFILRSGDTLRNTLPYKCPSLGFEEAFTYSTSLTQLCSTDIIRVIHQGGGPQLGASCGLGKFVPYTPPAKPEE